MMHLTDITGLAGVALAIVTLALRVPFFSRLQLILKIMLAAGLVVIVAIPFDGLSTVEFVRGISGDLSITTQVFLILALLPSPPGVTGDLHGFTVPSRMASCFTRGVEGTRESPVIRTNKNRLMALVTLAALALYPFALGIGTFDPYRLGFGHLWFISGLLIAALVAWFRQYTLIAICVSLAVLAWSIDWYESNNLWNYLLDPWISIYALSAMVKQSFGSVSRSK